MTISVQTRTVAKQIRTFFHKKSVLATTSGLLMIAAVMAVTNPGRAAYVDYASERLSREFKQDCDELDQNITFGSILELPTKDLCKSFVGSADLVGRGTVKLIIDKSTSRKNFAVFSIYTTKIAGRTFKTTGICSNFITFYHR